MGYKYQIDETMTIQNKILYLHCHCITKSIAVWCLQPNLIQIHSISSLTSLLSNVTDIKSFAHHFIVSSATIFICSYLLGIDWNEVVETCFVHNRYGDVYQLSPLSILFDLKQNKKQKKQSLEQMLAMKDDNVYLAHVYKLLCSLQKSYEYVEQFEQKKTNENNLWNIWRAHIKRLFHIILFNINQQTIEKKDCHYFDHCHLFQIIKISKMLFGKYKKMKEIHQHFGRILNAEISAL